MKFSFQVLSAIFVVTGFQWIPVTQIVADPQITYYDDFTSCGGSLPISPLYATVIKIGYYNTICEWRLLPEGNITKLSMEITSNATSSTTGFVFYHWNDTDCEFSTSKIPLENATVTFDTVPLFLSFHWRSIDKSSLSVRLVSNGTAGVGKAAHDFRFKTAPGKFVYPENTEFNYFNNSLVTVVLPNFNASLHGVKQVIVKSSNLDPRHDMLKVYSLFAYWDPLLFQTIGTITDNDVQLHSSINGHSTIILFKSVRFNKEKGFSLEWKLPDF